MPQSYRSHISYGLEYGDLTELIEVPGIAARVQNTHR